MHFRKLQRQRFIPFHDRMKMKETTSENKIHPLKENSGWVGTTGSIIDLFHDDYRRRRRYVSCLPAWLPPRHRARIATLLSVRRVRRLSAAAAAA